MGRWNLDILKLRLQSLLYIFMLQRENAVLQQQIQRSHLKAELDFNMWPNVDLTHSLDLQGHDLPAGDLQGHDLPADDL